MSEDPFHAIPAAHRETARFALADVLGSVPLHALTAIAGGASGASLFRAEAGARSYLLRIEGPPSPLLRRNPHRHACARMAAEAGVAPPIHLLDEVGGVMVMDFVTHRPLGDFPGGSPALAQALGGLLARLQTTPAFPKLVYYPDLVARMLDHVHESGVFAEGLLDPHLARLADLRRVCDWDDTASVSSHNDLNLGNILFDGERLWLIDWESAYRNDPFVDVAIVLDSLASTPELEEVLLKAWLGRVPDAAVHRQLAAVRALTRLYYACFLLDASSSSPHADLSALSPLSFQQAIRDKTLGRGTSQATHALGRIFLNGFLTDVPAPGLSVAVAAALEND